MTVLGVVVGPVYTCAARLEARATGARRCVDFTELMQIRAQCLMKRMGGYRLSSNSKSSFLYQANSSS